MSTKVHYRGEKSLLNDKASYTLWYGLYVEPGCNLAIVEAKRIGENPQQAIKCRIHTCEPWGYLI